MVRRFELKLLSLIFIAGGVVAAQSPPPRKDIPTIAKAAKGAIVTIVMANNDKPIARGTGFLVGADGAIMTNYHVVATGNVGVVKFADGTILPVDGVLATDKFRDLAIIKIHGKIFPTLTLGNSDQIQVGEEVVAIGNPLGLELTVSNGILSGIRSDEKEDGKLLQITAPISRGSSGGPLFNMFGEVVGINAMFLEGGESLNFAIPINEAKPLLLTDLSRLQNLPNEHQPIPAEEPPSPKDEEPVVRKEQAEGPYYVRARKNETYIIEFRGHELAAQCREALDWGLDTSKLGTPLTERECKYLRYAVGTHISEDKMIRQDNELRFRPRVDDQNAAQVADVLDITDDVLIGAPKHLHPAPKTSPDILKTLQWIQNTLDNNDGNTIYQSADGKSAKHINLLTEKNGCHVTFVSETKEDFKAVSRFRLQVNLGDLDPASLKSDPSAPDILGPVISVRVRTTNEMPSIKLSDERNWELPFLVPTTDIDWELPPLYAERFVKALHRAITLCGGKASTF